MLTMSAACLPAAPVPTITTASAISQAGPWRVTCRAHRCQPRAARVWAACRRAGATRRPSSEISTGPMTSAVTTANSVTTTMPNAADRIDRLSTSSSVDSASSTGTPTTTLPSRSSASPGAARRRPNGQRALAPGPAGPGTSRSPRRAPARSWTRRWSRSPTSAGSRTPRRRRRAR